MQGTLTQHFHKAAVFKHGPCVGRRTLDAFVLPQVNNEVFRRRFAAWLLKTNTPLSRLQHPDLKAAMASIGAVVPNRRNVSGPVLNSLYEESRAGVVDKITAAGAFSISMDGWKKRTAEQGNPIVTVVVLLPEGGAVFWKVSLDLQRSTLYLCGLWSLSSPLTNMFVQILKPSKTTVKDAQWVAEQSALVAAEVMVDTGAEMVGYVMDSAAANRKAYEILDAGEDTPPLVYLQCASHTLSLLLKDLDKRFEWVHDSFAFALKVAQFFHTHTRMQGLLEEHLKQQSCTKTSIPTHCDTRFGSKYIVLKAVSDMWTMLMGLVCSSAFATEAQSNPDVEEFKKMIMIEYACPEKSDFHLIVELCEPIFKALTALEADKAYLSRMLPVINSLTVAAATFSLKRPDLCDGVLKNGDPITMNALFKRRLKDFYYKKCMAGAYMLDPINFEVENGELMLPFNRMTAQEIDDATNDIERLGGQPAIVEMQQTRYSGINGLDNLAKKCLLDCTCDRAGSSGEGTYVPSVQVRRGIWLRILSVQYPALAGVACKYLSMHASSCASERTLSVFGRIYNKTMARLHLDKAEKMVFLSFNDRVQRGLTLELSEKLLIEELGDSEDAELQLEPDEAAGGDHEPAAGITGGYDVGDYDVGYNEHEAMLEEERIERRRKGRYY